jgi:hypothetical protein
VVCGRAVVHECVLRRSLGGEPGGCAGWVVAVSTVVTESAESVFCEFSTRFLWYRCTHTNIVAESAFVPKSAESNLGKLPTNRLLDRRRHCNIVTELARITKSARPVFSKLPTRGFIYWRGSRDVVTILARVAEFAPPGTCKVSADLSIPCKVLRGNWRDEVGETLLVLQDVWHERLDVLVVFTGPGDYGHGVDV